MTMKNHRSLLVWNRAMQLVAQIYVLTNQLPKHELYGLSSQMQRAVVSVPSNIAEGYSRNHKAEYVQFLSIARASLAELDIQLEIASLTYTLDVKNIQNELAEIYYMLTAIILKLRS